MVSSSPTGPWPIFICSATGYSEPPGTSSVDITGMGQASFSKSEVDAGRAQCCLVLILDWTGLTGNSTARLTWTDQRGNVAEDQEFEIFGPTSIADSGHPTTVGGPLAHALDVGEYVVTLELPGGSVSTNVSFV